MATDPNSKGLWLVLVLSLMVASLAHSQAASSPPILRELVLGQPIGGSLADDGPHRYGVQADEGDFLHLVVRQREQDVGVRLVDPAGSEVFERDGPNGRFGPEYLSVVVEVGGTHTLEIERVGGSGNYEVELLLRRKPTPRDLLLVRAESTVIEGTRLRREKTPESYQASVDAFRRALEIARSIGDARVQIEALRGIGLTSYARGRPRDGYPAFEEAASLLRERDDPRTLAQTLTSVGWALDALGRSDEAVTKLEEALEFRRLGDDRKGEGVTLNNLGNAWSALGEPTKALEYFQEALGLRRQIGDQQGEAVVLTNLGKLYNKLGDGRRALAALEKGLAIFRQREYRYGQAVALNHLGRAHLLEKDFDKAIEAYEESTALHAKTGNRRELGIVNSNFCQALVQAERLEDARSRCAIALSIVEEERDERGRPRVLSKLGLLALAEGSPEKAFGLFERALEGWRRTGQLFGEVETFYGMARAKRQQGDPRAALHQIERGVAVLESLRGKITSQGLRQSLFVSNKDLFDLQVELLMELHRKEPSAGHAGAAFRANEMSRARSLMDMLARSPGEIRTGLDPELLSQEKTLRLRIRSRDLYLGRLRAESEVEEIEKVKAELEDLLAQYDLLLAELRRDNPKHADLVQPRLPDPAEVAGELGDEATLFLEYFLGVERSFLWAISTSGWKAYELPPKELLESKARRLTELIRQSRTRPSLRIPMEVAALQLSREILGPVSDDLAQYDRLTVVADGALHYVPFSALPSPPTHEGGQAGRPLVESHEFVVLPSASSRRALRRVRSAGDTPPGRAVAVFADPVFESGDPRVSASGGAASEFVDATDGESAAATRGNALRAAGDAGLTGFERLVASRREAEAVAALVPPESRLLALDFDASRKSFLGASLEQYRWIHVATHAFLNSAHPELSGLVLSLVDHRGEERDGFVQMIDLLNMKLNADLVVLSGCQTALGEEVRGEGLVGLTRAFMYAGGRSVLATLWSVDDPASAELIGRFYRGVWERGLSPSAALRQAQRELRQIPEYRSPFYWAGFVLAGDDRQVR